MALTDLFIRRLTSSKPNGEKHADGGGMYLLVKGDSKYWRMATFTSASAGRWPLGSTRP